MRYARLLLDAHTLFGQRISQIARSSEVISNAAQKHVVSPLQQGARTLTRQPYQLAYTLSNDPRKGKGHAGFPAPPINLFRSPSEQ